MNNKCTLIDVVRRGALNFEGFVSTLLEQGYIFDNELGFSRLFFNQLNQDDFTSLFSFFFPNKSNPILLLALGTPSGAYVVFDANKIKPEHMMDMLK